VDASVIDLPDVIQLSYTYPGSFKVLSTIGEEFPELIEQDLWFDAEWVEANPELATRVVRAIVEAMRKLTADTDYAHQLAVQHLPDFDEQVLRDLVEEYSARGIWPADGLLTRSRALDTMTFFNEVGEIDVGAEVTDAMLDEYFNFELLQNALAELDG
jgi:ABC-type nitrate/sulfonate/bicarbonate transport system substrate-binding protein